LFKLRQSHESKSHGKWSPPRNYNFVNRVDRALQTQLRDTLLPNAVKVKSQISGIWLHQRRQKKNERSTKLSSSRLHQHTAHSTATPAKHHHHWTLPSFFFALPPLLT